MQIKAITPPMIAGGQMRDFQARFLSPAIRSRSGNAHPPSQGQRIATTIGGAAVGATKRQYQIPRWSIPTRKNGREKTTLRGYSSNSDVAGQERPPQVRRAQGRRSRAHRVANRSRAACIRVHPNSGSSSLRRPLFSQSSRIRKQGSKTSVLRPASPLPQVARRRGRTFRAARA